MDLVAVSPILTTLLISVTAVHSQNLIQSGPVNALKKVGDRVTLECVTSRNKCDGVEWKKMEGAQSSRTVYTNGIGILNGFDRERYNVSSIGGCNLTIEQLQISDSGRFTCTQVVGENEEKKSCILVVISVAESCRSNVPSNTLIQNEGYTFSTAINVPAKSVEPSNVILFFPTKAADERETPDVSQPQTVKITLFGTAKRKENITQHVCRASFPPNTAADFDNSTATLDICTTPQLIALYPVENIAVSPPGPYYKDSRVTCTADGHPPPSFQWTNLKSGDVPCGETLVIDGEAGDKYTCTATNTVKRKTTSQSVTIEVSSVPACGAGCIAAIIICVVVVIIIILVVLFACYKFNRCPFYTKFHSITGKQSSDKNGDRTSMPLNHPEKLPRASETPAKV